jgi:HSP20 family protein
MALARRERFEFPELFRRVLDIDWDTSWLRVEEFVDDKTLVIRAELPDIDPDEDVELTIADGVLHIRAERREKSEHKDKGGYRSEFRYGSFVRTLPLPEGSKEDDVKATYKDGVLEVRVPVAEEPKSTTTTVQITRS